MPKLLGSLNIIQQEIQLKWNAPSTAIYRWEIHIKFYRAINLGRCKLFLTWHSISRSKRRLQLRKTCKETRKMSQIYFFECLLTDRFYIKVSWMNTTLNLLTASTAKIFYISHFGENWSLSRRLKTSVNRSLYGIE